MVWEWWRCRRGDTLDTPQAGLHAVHLSQRDGAALLHDASEQ